LFVCVYCMYYFFFQAEDGIRDRNVTGVQTCALPICARGGTGVDDAAFGDGAAQRVLTVGARLLGWEVVAALVLDHGDLSLRGGRSEERRVGKECRKFSSDFHLDKYIIRWVV